MNHQEETELKMKCIDRAIKVSRNQSPLVDNHEQNVITVARELYNFCTEGHVPIAKALPQLPADGTPQS